MVGLPDPCKPAALLASSSLPERLSLLLSQLGGFQSGLVPCWSPQSYGLSSSLGLGCKRVSKATPTLCFSPEKGRSHHHPRAAVLDQPARNHLDCEKEQVLIQQVWVPPESLHFELAPRGWHCRCPRTTVNSLSLL